MEAAGNGAAEQRGEDPGSPLGRRVLAAALSGAALSLLPILGGRASAKAGTTATTPPSGNGTTNGSIATTAASTAGVDETTATAQPKRPTPEDVDLLGFAQTVELSAVSLYGHALETGDFQPLESAMLNTVRQAHLAYGQSLSGLLGRDAPNHRNESMYTELEADFSGDAKSIITAAAALEDTLVATHTALVGQLIGLDGANLVASILIVEARQATVLKNELQLSLDDQLAATGEAITPSDHPVE